MATGRSRSIVRCKLASLVSQRIQVRKKLVSIDDCRSDFRSANDRSGSLFRGRTIMEPSWLRGEGDGCFRDARLSDFDTRRFNNFHA